MTTPSAATSPQTEHVGRWLLAVPVVGLFWIASNVAFFLIGIQSRGFGAYATWADGFNQFPLWVKWVYAEVGGRLVLPLFLLVPAVLAFRGRRGFAVIVAVLELVVVATTRLSVTEVQSGFALATTPLVLLKLTVVGGWLSIDRRNASRGIATAVAATIAATSIAVLAMTLIWPVDEIEVASSESSHRHDPYASQRSSPASAGIADAQSAMCPGC